MKAISYLLITQLKNKLLALKQKPLLLILYIIAIITIIIGIVAFLVADVEMVRHDLADHRIIYLIMAGVGLLFLYSFITTGLTTGSTLFTMADVGLLFVSPISSKKILSYGLISTVGKTLLTSIFILFQVFTLRSSFGFGFIEIMTLFILYTVITIVGQLLAIGLYIFTNGNQIRKNIVKVILLLFTGVLVLYIYLQNKEGMGFLDLLMATVDEAWFGYVPIAGWIVMIMKGVVEQAFLNVVIGIVLIVVFTIIVIGMLTFGKADYYEDVLISTEITAAAMKAVKEGKRGADVYGAKRKSFVRDSDDQVLRGSGAMTIFYKQLLEIRRANRIPFIDLFTIIACIGIVIAKQNMDHEYAIYGITGFLIYMLYFFTIMGRLKIELTKPFIYMIPVSSVKKVFAASITSILKPCVDAFIYCIVFILAGISDPYTSFFLALSYAASGALFIAFSIVYQRVLGSQPNKLLKGIFGVGLMLSLLAPGIGLSVLLFFMLPTQFLCLATLPYTLLSIAFTVVIFLLCGNLIDHTENL